MKSLKYVSAALLATFLLSLPAAHAADLYWDINGNGPTNTGATDDGGGVASGNWSTTDVRWNSDPLGLDGGGTGTYTAWTGGAADRAVFSAGDNATGTSTVTISALTAGGILVQEGEIILGGATATITPGGVVEINAGATLSTASSLRIGAAVSSATVATVQYKLNGPTAVLKSTNTGFAGSFMDVDAQIVLNGGGKFVYDGGAQINIINAQTGVNPAVIVGTGPLIVDATSGALAIAGAATYTGATEIIGGELRIRTSNDRLPVGTDVIVTSPGVLNLNGLNQRIGSLSGTGDVGTAAGTLTIQGSTSTVFDGALKNTANFNTPPAPASTGVFGRLIKNGTSTITFNGLNDINGSVTLNAGGITVGASGSLCGDLADLIITGGTLTLNNPAEVVENFGGTGGNVILNGTELTTDPATGATTANTTYTGVISGSGSIVKKNTIAGIAKTFTMTGLNTYMGGTTVDGGRVNSNSASGTGTGAVQVNTSGVLGGNGKVLGAITVAGGGTLTGGIGLGNGMSLTADSTVNIQSGGQIDVMLGSVRQGDFNNDGAVNAADYVIWRNAGPTDVLPNDKTPGVVDASDYADFRANFDIAALVGVADKLVLTAANALTLAPGSLVTVSGSASAPPVPGTYTILNYNTGYSGTLGSTYVNNATGFEIGAAGSADDVIVDNTIAKTFEVTISGVVQSRTWAAAGDGNWSADPADNANWTPVGQPNGPGAIGNFAGSGAKTVTITDSDKTLGVMNLNNTSGYTIAANGTNRLVMNAYGTNTAQINVLSGSHTISAAMYISKATTATISNASDSLSISGNIGLLTGLTKSGAGNMTVSGLVTGAGSITVSQGMLTLSGQNSYTGGTTIAAGATLVAANSGVTSATGGTGTNTVFGTLNVNSGARITNPVSIENGGVLNNSGTTATGAHTVKTGGVENILAGATASSATYTVSGGTLVVDGTMTGTATVNTGGVLRGTGNVASVTINNTGGAGRLQPGGNGTVGALIQNTTTGVMTFGVGSIFDIDIMGPGTQGVDYDTLYVQSTVATTGGLVINAAATIAIHDLSGAAHALDNQSFIILDYGSASNAVAWTPANISYTGPGSYTWAVTKDTANTMFILTATPAGVGSGSGTIPEPTAIGLLIMALAAFATRRRERDS